MSKYVDYKQSGVNIRTGEQSAEQISSAIADTFTPRVVDLKGGFAGLFRLDYDEKLFRKNYRNPVLVACTDGVGSKVQLAAKAGKFDSVGIDLVAMSVNDMVVQGAEPLFFLDYLALHRLEPKMVAELVRGISKGCQKADCALIGGETAEMPDTYRKNDFDLAGFAVGVVELDRIITGKSIRPGDQIIGLASSGLHSNGYSLVRNICFKKTQMRMTDRPDELGGQILSDVLLEPTRIYVRSIVKLLSQYKVKRVVHGMAHITGGGLQGNIPRVLPADCNAVIDTSSWMVPGVFGFLQKAGPVTKEEMFRVFNMGIGFVLVVSEDFADSICKKLTRFGEQVYRIGRISKGKGKVIFE